MASKKPIAAKKAKDPAGKKPSAKPKATASADASYPFPIVAVGASAGGLDAFTRLVKAIPADLRITFVILQHLSPTHESILPQLLAKSSRLPVLEAEDKALLEPGRIFVLPPNTAMVVEEGRLRLRAREAASKQMPVDVFLRSLAKDQPQRAVAVILSGAGTDGSLGVDEVKAAGGITFAQDPKTAKFDGMPHNAAMTGSVDFVLPPEKIAEELIRICGDIPRLAPAQEHGKESFEEGETKTILALLLHGTGIDFTRYKPTTVTRRIVRRMVLNRCRSLGEYADRLRQNPAEVQALSQDILIKVTSFFRDPEAFDALKRNVLPAILGNRAVDAPVRLWVPGCSTGEEVYSLAICLLECLGEDSASIEIQIFGTDVSEEALAKARGGIYLENIAMDVSPERLRRFFMRTGSHYQISKHIRDKCVFARQDITRDHPFSRIDLISCRNMLIYMDASLQKRVFPIFHYALKPAGYLMLGTSETVGVFSDLFHLVDGKHKFFARKLTSTRYPLPVGPSFSRQVKGLPREKLPAEPVWTGKEVQREADRLVLAGYSPPGVVVNGDLEILQFRGQTGAYLEPSAGRASLNLLKMARPPILMDLRRTMDKVKREGAPIRVDGIEMVSEGRPRKVGLEVIPLNSPSGEETYFLILFHEPVPGSPARGKAAGDPKSAKPGRSARKPDTDSADTRRLHRELEASREYLQSIIEKQDATNEELKSANEEILSSNEELQSMNEELETAKEELQSTNEELITLNEELQSRNLELNLANNDLNNLLSSVNMPILILDNELHIRRVTPVAEKAFDILPADLGRPIAAMADRFSPAGLVHHVGEMIDAAKPRQLEVQDRAGRWYSLLVRPYRTAENKIVGAVLVFIDIDDLRSSLEELRKARNFAEGMVRTVRIPLAVLDRTGRIRTANRAFMEAPARGLGEVQGRSIHDLGFRGTPLPGLRDLLAGAGEESLDVRDREMELEAGDGRVTLLLNAIGLELPDEKDAYILMTLEDITDRKRAEREIRRLNDELEKKILEMSAAYLLLEREMVERRSAEEELHRTMDEMESFSYSVSHDLRAPLRAIQGIAEALLEDYGAKLDATGQDYAQRIVIAGQRMDTLIQDLLTYGRLAKNESDSRACSLDQVVEEALVQLERDIRESGAKVTVEKPLGKVIGSFTLLSTVVLNLLSNAFKFRAPGRSPEVRVRTERVDSGLRMWVEDNGIGIDSQHHQTIFRVFERLHGVETYPGNGIGLAIVRKGVEHLGGQVGVESQPGGGSRFRVDFAPGEKEAP